MAICPKGQAIVMGQQHDAPGGTEPWLQGLDLPKAKGHGVVDDGFDQPGSSCVIHHEVYRGADHAGHDEASGSVHTKYIGKRNESLT